MTLRHIIDARGDEMSAAVLTSGEVRTSSNGYQVVFGAAAAKLRHPSERSSRSSQIALEAILALRAASGLLGVASRN